MKLDSVVLYSRDIPVITDFYKNKIGLELEYQQDNKYVSFKFDNGVRLGVKKCREAREIPGSQTFFLKVLDAKEEYKKAIANNLKIYKKLTEESWGIEFSVLDLDGNKIEFLQRKK